MSPCRLGLGVGQGGGEIHVLGLEAGGVLVGDVGRQDAGALGPQMQRVGMQAGHIFEINTHSLPLCRRCREADIAHE
jgi:hypothetical protein